MQEQEHHWQAPHWWYQKQRPATDEAYFENMCRVIFQAGLNAGRAGGRSQSQSTARVQRQRLLRGTVQGASSWC